MNTITLSSIGCFLLDMDGTFFIGDRLLPGAVDFLEFLKINKKPFFFLTNNSSHSHNYYHHKLTSLGLQISLDEIFTSGEAAAIHILENYPGSKVFPLATDDYTAELLARGVHLVSDQPDIVLLGFDTSITYNKLSKACTFIRAGARYIATHPDVNCPVEDGFIPDIGAMIAFIQAATGKLPDIIIGKPNRFMLEALTMKSGIPLEKMVMVGDRLYTDMAFSQHGVCTILTLTGETSRQDLTVSNIRPDLVVDDLPELQQFLVDHR